MTLICKERVHEIIIKLWLFETAFQYFHVGVKKNYSKKNTFFLILQAIQQIVLG